MLSTQQFHEQLRLFDPDQDRPHQMALDLRPTGPLPSPASARPPSSIQAGIRHSYGEMNQRQWSRRMHYARMGL